MFISQGSWIVVRRALRHESHLRGDIIKAGLTEKQARQRARKAQEGETKYNYWAMDKSSY